MHSLLTTEIHHDFMRQAMDQAQLAVLAEEVPIGAVLVDITTHRVIASSHNLTRKLHDPTAHAEMNVIRQACEIYGAQRIPECDLYVTLEPCPMCASAISFARIRHVYFAAEDIKSGGFINGAALVHHPSLHHKPGFTGGIYQDESATLLKDFFKARR